MLKDENHDIRMSLIKGLVDLDSVIKIDEIIQSIIPSIMDINANKSWRVRIQIMDVIPALGKILSKKNFMDKIFGICIPSLTDPVFAIREATCNLIRDLYSDFICNDFENKVCEKLKEMTISTSYLVRNTVVMFINAFADYNNNKNSELYKNFIEKKLVQILFKLSKDKISNVRMNSATALIKMKNILKEKNNIDQMNECISLLKKDTDIDVVKIFKE